MSSGDGNGDGDIYTPIESFNQFKADNAALCRAYREHVETKIVGLDRKITSVKTSIQWTVSICVTVSTILLMLVNWYIAGLRI